MFNQLNYLSTKQVSYKTKLQKGKKTLDHTPKCINPVEQRIMNTKDHTKKKIHHSLHTTSC